MAQEFRVLRPYEFHSQLVAKGRRVDGRALEEFRKFKLVTDAISTADSSSLVKLGNTSVACGCTVQLLQGHELPEDYEDIKVKVELPPICSTPTGQRTQNTAYLLTKMLKDILNDTQCIDRSNLHSKDLNQHWSINVEVICLNYDGSLLDVALIAVLTSLNSLKMTFNRGHEKITHKLSIISMPICSTFALIGDHFICDPSLEEETIAESIFHLTTHTHSGHKYHIDKIGGKSLTTNRLCRCIQLARKRTETVQEELVKNETNQSKDMDCT